MNICRLIIGIGVLFCLNLAGCSRSAAMSNGQQAVASGAVRRQRTFLFDYSATLTGLENGQMARVWLPIAASNPDQDVEIVSYRLGAEPQFLQEAKYRNHLAYVEVRGDSAGSAPLEVVYRVTRREVCETSDRGATDLKYLQADAMVPVGGHPLMLLADLKLPEDQFAEGRMLYDVVDDHMQYRKDKPGWGRGDAVWACDSGFGNCTDFHSLFISLARSRGIPSLFEIGFGLPEKRGAGDVAGYHCWAKFKPAGHGWVPVDISEANKNPARRDYFFGHLCENRVAMSTGRDLVLEPRQAGPPVNFLVYPYVEVGGRVYPAEQISHHFTYQDLE